jgi:hypothetical protein
MIIANRDMGAYGHLRGVRTMRGAILPSLLAIGRRMRHDGDGPVLTTLITQIAALGTMAFAAVFFAAQAAAFEAGRWLGRVRAPKGEAPEGSGVIIGSMLGLLGFILALTLSHATTRFEERRQGTLAEANAIGTAWLRAGAVGHPRGQEIAAQLRDYAALRIAFVRAEGTAAEITEINRRTDALQSDIWRNLSTITHERTDPVVASLMASLNEVFDSATAERFAFSLAIPSQILLLITLLPLAATAAIGFHLGLQRDSQRVLPAILAAMLASVVTLVLDLGSPRLGDIRTSARAYEWTVSGFGPAATGAAMQGRQ